MPRPGRRALSSSQRVFWPREGDQLATLLCDEVFVLPKGITDFEAQYPAEFLSGSCFLISPQVSLQPEVPGSKVAAWQRHIPRSSPRRISSSWMPRGLARHARKQTDCRVMTSDQVMFQALPQGNPCNVARVVLTLFLRQKDLVLAADKPRPSAGVVDDQRTLSCVLLTGS